ncbi:MAG: hypothetical protein CSA36_03960 [Draconibacterium sp.]|nr:MAG: hypothetical protein CSA36_03960 [Draconibacterium sp.]
MEKRATSEKRIYFGILLIVLGGFWVLERLNLIPSFLDDILISWQMLLIGIGIFSLVGGNRTTGTVLIVIGSIFLIPEVISIPYEIRQIGWPLIIIVIGVILLVTHGTKKESFEFSGQEKQGMDHIDDFVIFGGREVYVNSQNFHGGKTTSLFGGTEYDLRQVNLSPNGAVVDCLTLFGGCGFKVPPDWTVKNEVTAIFGAFTDRRGASLNHVVPDSSKILVIKGFAAFGGVEVKYL